MDFQWAKKAISIAQKRIDAVLDITPEDETDDFSSVSLPTPSRFETVLEEDEDAAIKDSWERGKESDGNGWNAELPYEFSNASAVVSVVDAEPNPIRDSHSEGLYQHSPTSNSPDEGGCSGDDHEVAETSLNLVKSNVEDATDAPSVITLSGSSKELKSEDTLSQNISCDDALTVVSSDIEVLRQGDSCSVASSATKKNACHLIADQDQLSSNSSSQASKELPTNVESLTAEIAQLRVQIQYQERRNSDLQARNQKLEKKSQEFMALKAACVQHNATEAMLMKKLGEKEAELASLLQEGEKLAESNGKISKELKRLKKLLSEQEQMTKKVSQLEIDKDLAREEVRALTAENNKLRATVRSLEGESSKVRTSEEILTADLRRKDEKIEKLTADLQRAETGRNSAFDEIKQLEGVIHELTNKVDQRELSSKSAEEFTKGLNTAIEEERRKNERQTCYIDSLEKRLSDMMEAQRSTAEMVALANQPLLITIQQLEEEIDSKEKNFEAALFEKEKSIVQVATEKDDLLRQNKEFLAELTKLRASNNESQRTVIELSTRLRNLENDYRRLEIEFDNAVKLADSLKTSLKTKEEEVEHLYVRMRTEAENVEKLNAEKQRKINLLMKKCEEYESNLSHLRESMETASKREVSRTPSTASMSVEQEKVSSTTHASLNAAQTELVEIMNKYEQSMRQVASLQAKLTEMESNSRIHAKTRKELQDLRVRYENLLEAHGEKIERIEELELDLEDVKKLFREQMELLIGKG